MNINFRHIIYDMSMFFTDIQLLYKDNWYIKQHTHYIIAAKLVKMSRKRKNSFISKKCLLLINFKNLHNILFRIELFTIGQEDSIKNSATIFNI